MSAVLRAAKIMRVNRAHPGVFARYHRGDPGILDGLWNGIKGAVGGFISGGPLGAIAGGAGGLISGSKGASTGVSIFQRLSSSLRPTAQSMPGAGQLVASQPMTVASHIPLPPMPQLPQLPFGPGNTTQSQPTDWDMGSPANGRTCQSGYHWNKSGYYSKKYGFIPKGTVCVKNRKRNPLNPRAASRALSRLTSTRKAMRGIERLMNRVGGSRPVRVVSSSNGRKRGCGCK